MHLSAVGKLNSFFQQVFDTEPNCGLRQECPANSFSIFLSTGLPLVSKPSLCINGKHLMKPLVNGDGRGINAAVMESKYFQVLSFRNFDTYLSNKSSEILNWLDGISDGDIVVMFTHDEAASKLDGETKSLINELGSGKIQNLQYRSQWYMISQKGTKGTFHQPEDWQATTILLKLLTFYYNRFYCIWKNNILEKENMGRQDRI